MKGKQHRAAIIGCGNIGCGLDRFNPGFPSTHRSAFLAHPRVTLVGLCDRDRALAESYAHEENCTAYDNILRMMRSVAPDIVSICTPDDTHLSVLKIVAGFPTVRGIWLEKPMAITLREARDMIATCKKKNIKLLVNHQRRYDRFYLTVQKRLPALVGNIQHVVCYYSGGIVTAGSHLIDLFDMYFGEVAVVSATHGASRDLMYATIIYRNGVRVHMLPCDTSYFTIAEISVLGSIAKLETINKPFGEYDYRYYRLEKSSIVPARFIANRQARPIPDKMARDFFTRAAQDLVSAIDQDRDAQSSGTVGIRSLEVLSMLQHSACQGGTRVTRPFTLDTVRIPHASGDVRTWKR
jgi:predicted dehydrogenase